ncbi:MAG TPA: glycosyltransferase family 39 protein [Gemmataceae bacterium]|jgi:4-amino-4-deoxy-L-arabinose transferase-like glycosyltransferase|nr:glycosyltransferase family 39 protein [Gemmataceae bacterium]
MFQFFQHRAAHYLLLLACAAGLTLPNLGRHSLWDVDEGTNAETAREMYESGDYVVLRFNYIYRDSKPALLFWLQTGSYHLLGVNEFAARFPSAVAAMLNVLLIYELGRKMFSPGAGLVAGVIQMTAMLVAITSQLAIPDALLQLFTTLTFWCFWNGYVRYAPALPPPWRWYVSLGVCCGLAILAKGPIGLVLPALIAGLFLAWQRQLRFLWNWRALIVLLACWLIAAPWFILETIQTRGWFAKGFFITNNVQRFFRPLENHRGPWFYHVVTLLLGFAPWSIFIAPTFWHAWPARRIPAALDPGYQHQAARKLLWCWIVAYFVFFTCAATKLPNYLLPLYPALSLLTADYLERWRKLEVVGRSTLLYVGLGILVCAGFLLAGAMEFANRFGLRFEESSSFKGWAWLGLVPVLGGLVAAFFALRQQRARVIATLGGTALLFAGIIDGAFLPGLDAWKAPRQLVDQGGSCSRQEEVRLASYHYTRPSLVFYSQREVHQLDSAEEVRAFLQYPLPVYLFIAEPDWQQIGQEKTDSAHVVAQAWDIHRNCRALVISNRLPTDQTSSRFVSRAE